MSADQPATVYTRRIDSRRFSVGPVVFVDQQSSCNPGLKSAFHLVGRFLERVVRESAAISVFCLLVVWVSYFAGVLDRDVLLISNGALILLLIIAALLKKRSMRVNETLDQRRVRRPFPRGAILRSASHPEFSEEDEEIARKVRSIFITHLISNDTETKLFENHQSESHSCVICLIDFVSDDPTQTLLCGHFFHKDCLIQVCVSASLSYLKRFYSGSMHSCRAATWLLLAPLAERRSLYRTQQ
jgi:hypothetical protein